MLIGQKTFMTEDRCKDLSFRSAEPQSAEEVVLLQQLLTDLRSKLTGATLLPEDIQAAVCMAKNPLFHGREKRIDIKYHLLREQVAKETEKMGYCRSD